MRGSTLVCAVLAGILAAAVGACSRPTPAEPPVVAAVSRGALEPPPAGGGSAQAPADCGADCSGRSAGYKWAWEHNIQDATQCQGADVGFVEGCQAFANGQQSQGAP